MSLWLLIAGFMVLSIGLLDHYILAERRLLGLLWPRKLTYYGMVRRATSYFRLRGWDVSMGDAANFDFGAFLGDVRLKITCYPSNILVSNSTLMDWIEKGSKRTPSITTLITADEVPKHIIVQALIDEIYIIRYTQLNELLALDPVSRATMRKYIQENSNTYGNHNLVRQSPFLEA